MSMKRNKLEETVLKPLQAAIIKLKYQTIALSIAI